MDENCRNCKFIDLEKVKVKTDSAGNKTLWYWCKNKKQYIQLDLYICNCYKLDKSLLETKDNGVSRTRKK